MTCLVTISAVDLLLQPVAATVRIELMSRLQTDTALVLPGAHTIELDANGEGNVVLPRNARFVVAISQGGRRALAGSFATPDAPEAALAGLLDAGGNAPSQVEAALARMEAIREEVVTIADGLGSGEAVVGADGASAYELAVVAGFVGTEAEWLASLVGPQGPVGPAGADGADGPQGLQGDVGPQGPQGPQGDAGPAGPQGVQGIQGPAGANGLDGADGADGVGVPAGGITGQVLAKATDADYDTAWVDQAAGGGGGADYAPAAYFPPANNYIANMLPGGAATSITLNTGYIYLSGIRFDRNITVADAGLRFLATGANARVVVYKQRADDETIADLVFEGAELAAAVAYVASTCNLTFEAGALYLIGCTMDASINIASVPYAGAAFAFGLGSGTSASSDIVARVAHTYANAAPATVPIPGSTVGVSSAPMVKFKVVSSTAG